MNKLVYKTDYDDTKSPKIISFNKEKPPVKTRVISNFLIKPFFTSLKKIVEGNKIEWFWHDKTLDKVEDSGYMFTHVLYSQKNEFVTHFGREDGIKASKWFPVFEPMLYFLKDKYNYKELIKVKMNLYINQGEQCEHAKHVDFKEPGTNRVPDGLITSVFNFTTCDGYTKIGNEKIPSKENELIVFEGRKEHCGSTPTNTKSRVVININVI
jgi:hypothetical protein